MILNALRSFALAAATASFALPAAADISFTLHNTSAHAILYFYASPSSSDEWGDDILGDAIIEPGESGTVTLAGSECEWDIKAVFDDEEELEDSIDACQTSELTISDE